MTLILRALFQEGIVQLLQAQFDQIDMSRIDIRHFDWQTSFGRLAAFILVILFLSFAIDYLLSRSVLGYRYRIFVAPGVIIHELSHMVLCFLTGTKVKKVSMFDKDGGSVEHGPSKIPILGQVLISFAPFAVGAVLIYFLSRKLGLNSIDFENFTFSYNGILHYILDNIKQLNLSNPKTWIIIYFTLSVAATMTPSWQDFRNVFWSLLVLSVILIVISRFTQFHFASILIPEALLVLLAMTIILLILCLILSIVVYGLSAVFRPI